MFRAGFTSLSLSWSLRVIALTLFCVLVIFTPSSTLASAPVADDDRPYIELPFPRNSQYEVTCGYGCYQHKGSMSYAVDFDVAEGDPIVSAAAGEVLAVTWEIGLPVNLHLGDALIVYVDHGNGWFTRYVHLQGVTVEAGDKVEMGDLIGYSGKTGASGAHLHFELKHGDSLHSPSVPINELFDGNAPVEGESYLSNNQTLTKIDPTATPDTNVRSVVEPTATPSYNDGPSLPYLSTGLAFSNTDVAVGEPVTATFTLRNNTSTRLQLTMLGIGAHDDSGMALRADTLFFDRAIILNPGREYQFKKIVTFNTLGDADLFAFALGPENEWLPLAGAVTPVSVTVTRPALTHIMYLPTVYQQAQAGQGDVVEDAPTATETPVVVPQLSDGAADTGTHLRYGERP